jgi:hypothetical protein
VTPEKYVDFDEWLEEGYSGSDPCIHILRLYEDKESKDAVECSHSPSVWRASNAGLGQTK